MNLTAKLLIGLATAATILAAITAFVANATNDDPPAVQIQKQDRDFEPGDPGLCDGISDPALYEECLRNRYGDEAPEPPEN